MHSLLRASLLALTLGYSLLPGTGAYAAATDEAGLFEMARVNDFSAIAAARGELSDPRLQALADARIAAARLDLENTRAAVDWFLTLQGTTAAQNAFAWSTLAGVAFARGDYALARDAASKAVAILEKADPNDQLNGVRQTQGIAALLAGAPAQTLAPSKPEPVAVERDKVGLPRAAVTIGTTQISAVLDTGANLSVVSASTAAKLGLRIIEGTGEISSATRKSVSARIGIADAVSFAGAKLRNVAFLVLEDEALTFPVPGGYTIDAIIGFPEFRALDRVTFTRDGWFRWGASDATKPQQNLFLGGSTLYVNVDIREETLPLHLDTGATTTQLSDAYATRHPALIANRESTQRQVSGAGGTTGEALVKLDKVTAAIDSQPVCIAQIGLKLPGTKAERADNLGTLGQDILNAYHSYAIDFRAMRFDVEPAKAGLSANIVPGACGGV